MLQAGQVYMANRELLTSVWTTDWSRTTVGVEGPAKTVSIREEVAMWTSVGAGEMGRGVQMGEAFRR